MTEARLAPDAAARHWLADALAGGALALGLITVAHAALPRADRIAASPRRPAASAPTPPPPEPKPLIAFQAPLPGREVGSPFGLRQLPWEDEGRLHAGVDIAAPAGEPIRVAADGVVVRMGQDAGYGRFVVVRHAEGLSSLYGHMGAFAEGIAPGVALKAGQPLGRIGSSGTSTGSHLHFEIHDARDRALNPELFLDRSFFRTAELPLRQAMRVPRVVRVAYVSTIPKAKKVEMEAKAAAEAAELAAADASAVAAPTDGAFSALASGRDAAEDGAAASPAKAVGRRPHARYRM